MNLALLSEKKIAFVDMVDTSLLDIIYDFHGYGFQDGGCAMFAHALSTILTDLHITNNIFLVGRKRIQDHFIVEVPTSLGKVYIDSEGFYDERGIIQKQVDFLPCSREYQNIIVQKWEKEDGIHDEIELFDETVTELTLAFDKNTLVFFKNLK